MTKSFDDGATPLTELADAILRVARELDPKGPRGADGVIGLSGGEAVVLRWIHRNPGTCASEAATATAIARSNISVVLRSLEGHGLIDRRKDAQDGRTLKLFVTPKAEENLTRLRAHWSRRLNEALAGDLDGVDNARAVLGRIEAGLHRSAV